MTATVVSAQISWLCVLERFTRRELILDRMREAVTTGELTQSTLWDIHTNRGRYRHFTKPLD